MCGKQALLFLSPHPVSHFVATVGKENLCISSVKKMASNWNVTVAPVDADGKGSATATSVTDPSVQHTVTFGVADGIPNLSAFTQERADYLNSKIVYKAGDIIIVSYPKCGTTWTEQCVLLLLCQGNNEVMDPSHKNTYIPGVSTVGKLWPEASINVCPTLGEKFGGEFAAITLDDFDNAPSPRVIKSHARCEQLLACQKQGLSCLPNGVKTLVVSRNPLDACVSSYYHAFNPFKCGWPFEAWAAVWLTGNVAFGSYFEWVRDWYYDVKRHPEKAMWLQYEDMQTDPRGQIVKIAAFLEIPVTDEIVDKVLHYSSFDSMKASAEAKGGNANGHLRQGKSGDWRNHFTPELVTDFRDAFNSKLAGTGLHYPLGEGEEPFQASV